MYLSRRALMLSVVLTLGLLLPTTFGQKYRSDQDSKLIDLLKALREKLDEEEAAGEGEFKQYHDVNEEFKSYHDNVNEEHFRNFEIDIDTSRSEQIQLSLRTDSALTDDQSTQLVNLINDKRRGEGAADMNKLYWGSQLAKLAQAWADQCIYKHGSYPFNMNEVGHAEVGGNLWAFTGPFDANKIVENWYNDKENFDPKSQTCQYNKPCGSYKQLVNAHSTHIGCGLTHCPGLTELADANFIVCYFAPPGNYRGEHTFHVGPPCTLCKHGQFYCDNGLCDKECTSAGANCECKADCQNCGKMTNDCKCECNPGSVGVNCGRKCEDHPKCGKASQGGWGKAYCQSGFKFVLDICPVMCNVCDPNANPCAREAEDFIDK